MHTRSELTTRQRELLERLEALFLTEGFARFTLDDLAAELRCSKSTLYTLAGSKEQLAARVVRRFFAGATSEVERRITTACGARQRIGRYLDAVAGVLGLASSDFIADVVGFPPTAAIYRHHAQAAATRIRGFIADGVSERVFRDVHAELIAAMVGVLVESIQSGMIADRTGVSHAEAFAALAELLLDGLAAG